MSSTRSMWLDCGRQLLRKNSVFLIQHQKRSNCKDEISTDGFLTKEVRYLCFLLLFRTDPALVFSLMKDEVFRQYPAKERKEIENQILEEVRGRMLEEIVLLETVKTLPKNKRAFKLLFPIGEFDMVIQDTDEMTCELYEIKHSNQIERKQIRHLSDEEKLKQTEHEFGTITKRTVLYRGKNQSIEDVFYRNVVEYLEELKA